jgi:hypothetical protein
MEENEMHEEKITIDVEKLRKDMREDSLGAFFGGGFGGAMVEAGDINRVSDEKLVEMAQRKGINLRNYQV